MKNELEKRKEIFEKQLSDLIFSFKVKRKRYYSQHIRLCWTIVFFNACLSFSLGISFVEKVAVQFKVLALLLSSVLLVFNAASSFLNYKKKYEQRTLTLIRLMALRREYEFKVKSAGTLDELDNLFNQLQFLMQEDLDTWVDNNTKVEGEKE